MLENYRSKFIPLILPICIIIFWYLITEGLHIVNPYILPGPITVCESAWELILNGKLLANTLDTLYKVFGGLILASVVAIPLGILLGSYKTLEDIATLVIAVFIIFMGCVFPILVYTIDGVKRTDKVLIESAQTLGASDWNVLKRVILPSTVPYIVSGLKVGIGIALMCTISAEMVGSSSGLGYMILTATSLFDPGTTVVGMLDIGLIGIVFDYIFTKAQDKIFW